MGQITDVVIECARESGLLADLDAVRHTPAKRRPGRPIYYSNESMLRAVVLKFLLNERYFCCFAELIEGNAKAKILCKFDEYTPCPATFSLFNRLLSEHAEALWDVFVATVPYIDELIADGIEMGAFKDDASPFGEILAIDSTDIESFSDQNRRPHIDPTVPEPDKPRECTSRLPMCCKPIDWRADDGYRTKVGAKDGKEMFYGYKLHTISDACHGPPLHAIMLPANESDTKQLRPLVEETLKLYPWLKPKYLLADRGYDSEANCVFLDSLGIIPIIAVRRPREDNENQRRHEIELDGPYGRYIQEVNADGYPVCLGNRLMKFVRTDPERGHLFRCAKGGCQFKPGQTLFPLECEGEIWVKPEGKMLRVVGKIPRFSKLWKLLYKLRTAIERYFSSAKRSRLLDTMRFLKKAKVEMHVAMSLLTYNATMLMRLAVGDYARMRHMRVKGR